MDIQFVPSLLAADFTRLGEQMREAEAAGAAMFHVDVMDGRFVPNITMGVVVVEAVRRVTELPLDVHLMIVEPDHLIRPFARAGANRITVHYEACPNLHRTLTTIQSEGCAAGVAINPHTPAAALSEIIGLIDQVIVMTVNPGFGGQKLIPQTLPKIAQVRALAAGHPLDIAVDGGIYADTAPSVVQAGANLLIVGSAVYSSQFSVADGMERLRAAVSGLRVGAGNA